MFLIKWTNDHQRRNDFSIEKFFVLDLHHVQFLPDLIDSLPCSICICRSKSIVGSVSSFGEIILLPGCWPAERMTRAFSWLPIGCRLTRIRRKENNRSTPSLSFHRSYLQQRHGYHWGFSTHDCTDLESCSWFDPKQSEINPSRHSFAGHLPLLEWGLISSLRFDEIVLGRLGVARAKWKASGVIHVEHAFLDVYHVLDVCIFVLLSSVNIFGDGRGIFLIENVIPIQNSWVQI